MGANRRQDRQHSARPAATIPSATTAQNQTSAPTTPGVAPLEALERMTDAFFALDADWRFTYLNAAAERLLERPRAELLGHIVWDEFPEAAGSIFEEQYTQARTTGAMVTFEAFYAPLMRWFSVRAYPSAGGDALTVYFQDVSAQHANERRRRVLYDTLPEGVVFQDAAGHITAANPAAEAILGLSRDDLTGRASVDLRWHAIHEDGTPWPGETHPAIVALRTGQPVRNATMGVFHPRDNAYRWIRVNAMPLTNDGSQPGPEQTPEQASEVLTIFEDITDRKRAREALRESEERFRGTFENAAVGMALVAPDGSFLRMNDRLCAIVGHPREELQAGTWQDITYPDDVEPDLEYVRQTLAGERDHYAMEKRFVRNDGALVWTQLTVALVRDAEGAPQYLISVLQDITERKRAEEERERLLVRERVARESAQKAETLLRAVLDVLPVGVIIANAEGSATLFNPAFYDLWGEDAPQVEHIGEYQEYKGWWAETGQLLTANEWALARALMRGDISIGEEIDIETFDGQRKTILNNAAPIRDEAGMIVGGVVAEMDITERKRLERTLSDQAIQLAEANAALARVAELAEERARQFSVILETMGDGVALIGPGGELMQTNAAFDRLLDINATSETHAAFARASLVERSALVRTADASGTPLPPEALPTARLLRGEQFTGSQALNLRLTGLAGREVVVDMSGVPLRDDAGQSVGGVLVLRDVTDRYAQEQERAHMLHVVAHELRSPLTSLKATIQINQRRASRGVQLQSDQLEPEARSVARMERLVNDLLDAARAETAQLELNRAPTDLAALCEQVTSEQMAASGRGIVLDLPSTPVTASVDGGRMNQVVGNLLSNALKYSPSDAAVILSLRADGSDALISVRDTGPGISPENLPRLFERFYRAPNAQVLHGSGVGLGVGLYLCKQFVERHGGSITVESELGRGSTFTVRLPRTEPCETTGQE